MAYFDDINVLASETASSNGGTGTTTPGTGGGGFRFIYAAFLQEAAKYWQNNQLLSISDEFTKAGDLWRQNAVNMAGVFRGRTTEQKDYNNIADVMTEIYQVEKNAFKQLEKIRWK